MLKYFVISYVGFTWLLRSELSLYDYKNCQSIIVWVDTRMYISLNILVEYYYLEPERLNKFEKLIGWCEGIVRICEALLFEP